MEPTSVVFTCPSDDPSHKSALEKSSAVGQPVIISKIQHIFQPNDNLVHDSSIELVDFPRIGFVAKNSFPNLKGGLSHGIPCAHSLELVSKVVSFFDESWNFNFFMV